MNNTTSQFTIGTDGTYITIDNIPAPLLSSSGFRNSNGAHLLRGR